MLQNLLQSYFRDPCLDEELINGCDQVLLLSGSQRRIEASPFSSTQNMIEACQKLAFGQNLRLDPLMPAAGGALELCIAEDLQHFRWHCLLPPVSRDGPLLSLRRHRLSVLDLKDFVTPGMMPLLEDISGHQGPLLIVGPTGAGKTSLMMALLQRAARDLRVAILEQLAELPRLQPGWIRLQAQAADLGGYGAFSLSQSFDELLRLRPDRIVIGELRQKEEAQAMRRAVLAGHGSVWVTLHASSPESLAARLADLAQENVRVWQALLEEQAAHMIVMGREFPRVQSIWQFTENGLKKKAS
ncbi:MAG TPA: ATPase, T2SS/T4P/T4SS family [Oligoflexus sp.]|uniref:ATPase, T2SS/T4P/T4SS family n=1 Tax=Oligoflexus sp. TaxID=1971216 RepID=UPI002D25E879|nr:ATPase, T2SS/T4P/T4SS family [Oligoflexus sp.]HYX32047.1 ATPase, T2SS/T4P/T4SS family [Oligoflexus sp.]